MSTLAIRSRWPALALLLLSAACGRPAAPAPTAPAAGEWHAFDGTWTASGSRTFLHLGSGRQASVLHLKGSLILNSENRLGVGFRAEIVEFSDTVSGVIGRAVWTDERGDRVFSELQAAVAGPNQRIAGTLIGGTGRYAGVTGDYEFQWQYVVLSDDGSTASGRAVDLKGRFRPGDGAR